ncbi:hypothetical protein SLA2020_140210 [Shorea laevis]
MPASYRNLRIVFSPVCCVSDGGGLLPLVPEVPCQSQPGCGYISGYGYGYVDPIDLTYYDFAIPSVIQGESDEDSYLVIYLPKKAIRFNFWGAEFPENMRFCAA